MGDSRGRSSDGEFRAVHAIRDAIPTRRHAEMLFEMVVSALGDAAFVETVNGGTVRTLFRRESPESRYILPWPLLTVARGGREGPSPLPTEIPGVYEEPRRRPGRAPRLRNLGPGHLDVHDGPHRATITYGGDGRWFECCRSASPDALAEVVSAVARRDASPVEQVADYVSGLDLRRHGPGRVYLPVPVPAGVRGVWNCGLFAMRERLFDTAGVDGAGILVADGWRGQALAHGSTREAAMDAWRSEVVTVRPFPDPPPPQAGAAPEPRIEQTRTDDGFRIEGFLRGPSSDVPWFDPTPETCPAALVPVMAWPVKPSPVGAWTRLVGGYGTPVAAALHREPGGFTLIGDRLGDRVDLPDLEPHLAAADRNTPDPAMFHEDMKAARNGTRVRTYRFAEGATADRLGVPSVSTSYGAEFAARSLDGDELRWAVVRMTRAGV